MTSTPPKSNLATVSTFEIDDSAHAQSPRPGSGQASTLVDSPSPSRILDTARLAITIVALLLSVAIIGVSADNLKTYKDTSLSREYELPLWPYDFNRGPTEALIACASIIAVSSIVAVLGAKVSKVRPLLSSIQPT